MKPSDIGKAYDTLTDKWLSDKFNRNNGIDAHKRALAFTKSSGPALDVGCGCTGRFIELLLENDFQPEGVDVSEKMIFHARERHAEIHFYHEDICEWTPPKKYDFITAWDSIWHIPLSEQENVLTKLVDALNENGVLIFSCGGTEEAGGHTDDYMGPEVYYSSLGLNGFASLFIEQGCMLRHIEFDQYPELHTYFIVQKIG